MLFSDATIINGQVRNKKDYTKDDFILQAGAKVIIKASNKKGIIVKAYTYSGGYDVKFEDGTIKNFNREDFNLTNDTKDIEINETPDSEFDSDELALGIKTELEHTDNLEEASSIAKDHLQEDKKYYTKLAKVENKDAGEKVIEDFRNGCKIYVFKNINKNKAEYEWEVVDVKTNKVVDKGKGENSDSDAYKKAAKIAFEYSMSKSNERENKRSDIRRYS